MEITAKHRHLFDGHRELLTPSEQLAWRHLQVERMIQLCQYPDVKNLFKSRWLTTDPDTLTLISDGIDRFYSDTLARLDGDTQLCPLCHALCRTSRARLCPECSHTWFT